MNINSQLKQYKTIAQKKARPLMAHSVFALVLLVLLVYLFMIWRISSLAKAEPTPEAQSEALLTAKKIPRVDKNAIAKIQKLEASNTQLQALFNKARSNPFQE